MTTPGPTNDRSFYAAQTARLISNILGWCERDGVRLSDDEQLFRDVWQAQQSLEMNGLLRIFEAGPRLPELIELYDRAGITECADILRWLLGSFPNGREFESRDKCFDFAMRIKKHQMDDAFDRFCRVPVNEILVDRWWEDRSLYPHVP